MAWDSSEMEATPRVANMEEDSKKLVFSEST